MHRETEKPFEVATTVLKEPVAKNCSATANWVLAGMECDRVVDRWRKLTFSPLLQLNEVTFRYSVTSDKLCMTMNIYRIEFITKHSLS